MFFWKKVHLFNKKYARANKICVFHLFILILQPFLGFYIVVYL